VRTIKDLAGDWHRLDERIACLSAQIEAIARQDAGCARLMSVPGIGPIVFSYPTPNHRICPSSDFLRHIAA